MDFVKCGKYVWYTVGTEYMRVSKEFKNFVIYLIETENSTTFYSVRSLEDKKKLLGLFLEGLPMSHLNDAYVSALIDDKSDNCFSVNYIKHLTVQRDPSAVIERVTELLMRQYEIHLSSLFDSICEEFFIERKKSSMSKAYDPTTIMKQMGLLGSTAE